MTVKELIDHRCGVVVEYRRLLQKTQVYRRSAETQRRHGRRIDRHVQPRRHVRGVQSCLGVSYLQAEACDVLPGRLGIDGDHRLPVAERRLAGIGNA